MVRLLVADPKQRLSMEGIKKHPWFLEQLPAGSLQMNGFYKHCPSGLEQVQPSSAPAGSATSPLESAGNQGLEYGLAEGLS